MPMWSARTADREALETLDCRQFAAASRIVRRLRSPSDRGFRWGPPCLVHLLQVSTIGRIVPNQERPIVLRRGDGLPEKIQRYSRPEREYGHGARIAEERRCSTLALLLLVQFLDFLDVSIVNVALPSIRHDLGFSEQSLQWVVSGYVLTYGGFLLLGGRAADLVGRRRILVSGLALFGLASLAGGLAQAEECSWPLGSRREPARR